jgi:hypothetical protein
MNRYVQEDLGVDENYGEIYGFGDSMTELGPIAYDLRFSAIEEGNNICRLIGMGF